MTFRLSRMFLTLLVVAAATMLPVRAFADLGGDVSSIGRDGARMKTAITVRQAERYAIHEMRSDSGAAVREFATPEGKVFAVAWQGEFPPDFQQLLGAYFPKVQQAMGQRRARRAPVMIDTPGFVFQSLGHFRALAGRAYIPQLIPNGVSVEEIQ